jgi:hypothetical protein
MCLRRSIMLMGGIFLLAAVAFPQQSISEGTILPVRLDSALGSASNPGGRLTATVMQNVPLPEGASIRAGTKLIGHVTSVRRANVTAPSEVSFRFDEIALPKRAVPITAYLRAIAGFVEVYEAQIPATGSDRGTSPNVYVTQQIGGDIVYRGGGPVEEDGKTVGQPVYDGVLTWVQSNATACSDGLDNSRMQAMWVFSADACGTYGLPGISIAHAGRSNPVGEVTLRSDKAQLKVSSGAGLLLRVIASKPS